MLKLRTAIFNLPSEKYTPPAPGSVAMSGIERYKSRWWELSLRWIEGNQTIEEVVLVFSQSFAKGFPWRVVRTSSLGLVIGDVIPNHFSGCVLWV